MRRGVSLADDRRARVPFALLGVLLLLGSTTYAAADVARTPTVDDSADRAMERASAAAVPALRTAVAEASRDAAAEPVTVAADTVAGDALDDPFRDALRIRIYLAAAAHLEATGADYGAVSAAASVPPVEHPEDLATARDRVEVEPIANGTAMRVSLENVTVTAERGGRVVARETETLVVTVATPVLAVHERTERFERRANRGPLDGPGLGRRLTIRLHPVVWARGAAQYGGAPVQNVLANRHIELSTNAGLLRTQRAAFGASDPRAARGVERATARTGVADLLAPSPLDEERWTDAVVGPAVASDENGAGEATTVTRNHVRTGDSERTLDANPERAADAAFLEVEEELEEILRASYRAEASLETEVETLRRGRPAAPGAPGENWTLVRERVETTTEARGGSTRRGEGSDALTANRRVVERREVVRTWTDNGRLRETTASTHSAYRVTVRITVDHAPADAAPNRPLASSGRADGPVLRGASSRARERLLGSRDVDAVAVESVERGPISDRAVVYGDRPADLSALAAADLRELREEVRAVNRTVDRRRAAAGRANPPSELAADLRSRRDELADAPRAYDGVSDRARTAARAAYVDAVAARLDERARTVAEANEGYLGALGEQGPLEAGRVDEIVDLAPSERPSARPATDGLGGRVAFVPRASPGYLPRTAVGARQAAALEPGERRRPLVVRNVNVFAVPHGAAAEGIVERLFGSSESVPLPVAGRTLVAADRTLERTDDPELREERDALDRAVRRALRPVEGEARATLREETALSRRERRAAVRAAFDGRTSAGSRAVAAANGSLAADVAEEAAARQSLTPRERDRLETALRVSLASVAADDRTAVDRRRVNDTAGAARRIARAELEAAVAAGVESGVGRATERWAGEALGSVYAGLPVTPVPGYWYATVNAWTVEVRGEYPRFAVEATDRTAAASGEPLRYVRESNSVDVQVGDDRVRLGYVEPVRFETETVVVIAVPPGGRGVGDVDGTRDERSPGWPCPDRWRDCESRTSERSEP